PSLTTLPPPPRSTLFPYTTLFRSPISGEMLNLQIYRTSGLQDVVLSSTFRRRDIPFFYSGDSDISSAQPLLKFIGEHVWTAGSRSEEHTSELQSRFDLVCRLLLEK